MACYMKLSRNYTVPDTMNILSSNLTCSYHAEHYSCCQVLHKIMLSKAGILYIRLVVELCRNLYARERMYCNAESPVSAVPHYILLIISEGKGSIFCRPQSKSP